VDRIGFRDKICFVDRVGFKDRICFVDRVGFVGWKRMDRIKLSAFRPRGVPGPTSKLSLRVPAQMGRRETKHRGRINSKGEPAAFVLSCAQGRWMRLQ
jgi:hypothetical protein